MRRSCSISSRVLPVRVARLSAGGIGQGRVGGGIGLVCHAEYLEGELNSFFGRGFARLKVEAMEWETLVARVVSIIC